MRDYKFRTWSRWSTLPSCAPVNVAEYASISLNMPKYPWKWLNKLFWLCQSSEDACWSYIFGRLLKMPPVLTKPGFWIWHGCIRKSYAEFQICLIMAPYGSIRPECASVCLNVPQYAWTWLDILECSWMNIPEYAWINCSDYARVLNMSWYSYNNIIIFVAIVIRLEFLSATILCFLTQVRT